MKHYTDLTNDGGSKVTEQLVARREKIQSSLAGFRHRVALGSGKGGVGKSTLTMLLALGLKERGARPVILDADINGPVQARLGGLQPAVPLPGKKGLTVPLSSHGVGVVSFASWIPEPQAVNFPSVSSGNSFAWRAAKEFSTLADIVTGTDWSPFDLLLVDLPPGAEKTSQFCEFFGGTAHFILVTLPSRLSRAVVGRSVAALNDVNASVLGYVENMKGYYCRRCGEVRPLFPSGQGVDLGIPCIGTIPFDPDLADLCDRGFETAKGEFSFYDRISETCQSLLERLENTR